MAKNILIVESDPGLSHSMRAELESRGFSIEETSDGKTSIDRIRRERPDLVVMEVDLSAGQNGYILCGKLKKDDELKAIPIVIVGNPEGFAQHRKLKTRADEYVAKPVDVFLLAENVGALIGFPEIVGDEVVEESVSFADLVDVDEEIQLEESAPLGGDPELDMLDEAFESATAPDEDPFSALDALGDESTAASESTDSLSIDELGITDDVSVIEEDDAERTVIGVMPDLSLEEPQVARVAPPPFDPPSSELRTLRGRVAQLENALGDATYRSGEQESRIHELEVQLSLRDAELETARSSASDGNKEQVFALRAESNNKGKEILRLKSDLNAKDQEISDLQDKVLQLEQQQSEGSGELARKDAQIKTLQTRADQLSNERKRFDQQLLSAREEARTAAATFATLQSELDELRQRADSNRDEAEELRIRTGDLESELRQARDEAGELRTEADQLRAVAEISRRELDEVRGQIEQAQMDLDAANGQLDAQSTAFADESSGLRRRVVELEEAAQKSEDRVARFYSKIKDDEKVREKTRKALAIALQLLDEQQQARIEIDVDEPAEA